MSIARARLHSDDHRFFLPDVAEAQDALAPFIQDALAPSEFLRAIAFINSISASASLRFTNRFFLLPRLCIRKNYLVLLLMNQTIS